ncbi:MAG: Ig domain-containing protein [Paludibacteraceae bacterium]|nr:Ig domain-containing protein [Paludibacteraceae bacterium]
MDGDNYLVYYGYDAATDGNGTVSVKNGSTDVTSTSKGYKTTTYTFTATPSDGYKFKNWTKGAGGEVLGTDASINVTCEQNGQYQVYANFEEFVAVTGVTLSQTEATLNVDETLTLTATVLPDDATDKTVTWTSSDETIATVVDGVVTAVAAGTATITVTTTDGSFTATCTITVIDPDQVEADAVVALFDALPAVANITLEDKAAIETARAAYEALTAEQKALVSAEDLAKLTAAEQALAALVATAVENIQGDVKNVKILKNGQIFIIRNNQTYTVTGQEVK